MPDFFEVKCPECETILIVRRRDGKIVEVRKPLLEDSSGDRFEDAMEKVRQESDTIAKKFEEAKEREKNKMERLEAIFKEGIERAKEEGPIRKPHSPFDHD